MGRTDLYKTGGGANLIDFSDIDYTSDLDDKKVLLAIIFDEFRVTSWSSKKQQVVTLSATEIEFITPVACASPAIWLKPILRDVTKVSTGSYTTLL